MNRLKKILISLLAIVLLLSGAVVVYASDYYHGDKAAKELSLEIVKENGAYIISPDNPKAGLIFYPGGKVEDIAYLPLMQKFADEGILCVLLHMPLNLAILDANKAEGFKDMNNDIDWYLGGHSLGGIGASMYLKNHSDEFKGLLLLGSYVNTDLSNTNLKVLSVYGSKDGVMDRESYRFALEKLPKDFKEVVIEGGCHAGFGNYGKQKGDNEPDIDSSTQQEETVKAFLEYFMN